MTAIPALFKHLGRDSRSSCVHISDNKKQDSFHHCNRSDPSTSCATRDRVIKYQQPYANPSQDQWPSSPTLRVSDTSSDYTFSDLPSAANFTDGISNEFQLAPEHRNDLHTFRMLADQPGGENLQMVYLLAAVFKCTELGERVSNNYNIVKDVLEQAMAAIGQNLAVTKGQKADMRIVCHIKVFDPKRTSYDNDTLCEEVLAHLKKNRDTNDFKAVFQSNAQNRLRAVTTQIRTECTYAKSDLRGLIKADRQVCLTVATSNATRKMTGSADNITVNHVFRMALLRRFARENPNLLEDIKESGSNKRARNDDNNHDDTPTIRRPRTNEADSWWGKFSAFLAEKSAEWGSDMKSAGWSEYLNSAIAQERSRFPNDAIDLIPQAFTTAPVANVQAPVVNMEQPGGNSSSAANGFSLPSLAQMTASPPLGALQGGSRANINAAYGFTSMGTSGTATNHHAGGYGPAGSATNHHAGGYGPAGSAMNGAGPAMNGRGT
ncbi:hypothetical protein C8F01DRAFT_1179609 [Mycena amicta]|nr:hypothetical protein C8F01DRAFT_1179609 [Mycena amicta]